MHSAVADVAALLQVVLLDLALAGDNAVAVGLAASALPKAQQRRVIFWGISLALVLRILFATGVKQLLQIEGVLLVGGLLLFWVAWRMWSDIAAQRLATAGPHATGESMVTADQESPASFAKALLTIVVADVSMSLDNVLAVAGVARHSADWILWFGLVLAVALMGVAASVIARAIHKYPWIAIVGLVVVVFAATRMVWEDAHHFWPAIVPAMPEILGPAHPPA